MFYLGLLCSSFFEFDEKLNFNKICPNEPSPISHFMYKCQKVGQTLTYSALVYRYIDRFT